LLLWQLGSLAALWGALRLMPRLAGEEPAPLTSTAVLVPLLMSARLLQEHFQHTQINIYVLFLILLAFHLFQQRHNGLGGLALAVAVSLRAVPVILLLYLLYKRAWRAAAWTGGFLLVINLFLPVAVFGSNEAAERWRSWRAIATAETQDPTPGYSNQSLLAALKRSLTNADGTRRPSVLRISRRDRCGIRTRLLGQSIDSSGREHTAVWRIGCHPGSHAADLATRMEGTLRDGAGWLLADLARDAPAGQVDVGVEFVVGFTRLSHTERPRALGNARAVDSRVVQCDNGWRVAGARPDGLGG
jgi:hypothetical protein